MRCVYYFIIREFGRCRIPKSLIAEVYEISRIW